ncbi:insulinase family protein [Mangrovimonas sp. CR14]|uniref:M16 family metallopeptidase n=1 Tax=Mangrovimonas sp. CR14 TaxID=2706120 RepID=UPI0014235A25|nr:M16 family metallopeptidase [Mangrovimonas sp. CR14]NIK93262.1 insulinase family protein [Mangrovimonas sp. CR14]
MKHINFKNNKSLLLVLFFLGLFKGFSQQNDFHWEEKTSNGYTYKYVSNDPMQARFYTLDNGLQVILSVNQKEPRIAVNIAVRAGSNNDPKEHTGLAHYLEHILFKGTDKFGSLDWEKEAPLLQEIEELYEVYNKTTDPDERKEIYTKIDQVSNEASKYAIAGEYDKLMTEIGSQSTNAHTWVEETVYKEDIPSNAIDKFLDIQAERFRNPVVRLFHTELEAVYEEKNRSSDNDGRKVMEKMSDALFPTHNYGQQTTIGTIEHLKNPSISAIKDYYQTYYVPNNMAIIMVGDFNPDLLIEKIDNHFSYMAAKTFDGYNPKPEKPISEPITREVFGPTAENIRIAWRTPEYNSKDARILSLISNVLSNGKAGLLDINIKQKQVLQEAYNFHMQLKDYGVFAVAGTPKEGQSLDEVKDILMGEIEKLKKGDFSSDLLAAIISNYKLQEQQALKFNNGRLSSLLSVYIKSNSNAWDEEVASLTNLSKITKEDVVRVANKYFRENYVAVYKRKGTDKSIMNVEKPPITPIETNAGKQSAFVKNIKSMKEEPIQPSWVDFKKDLQKVSYGNTELLYVHNDENQLFNMTYRFDMGEYHNAYLPLAISYFKYLSTNKYSSEELNKKLYALASNYSISVSNEETTVNFYGLNENFDELISLFEYVISNCEANENALEELKSRIFKIRKDNKSNKRNIFSGLNNYAVYGEKNPFNDVLSNEDIQNITSKKLVDLLHSLLKFKHEVSYYGPLTVKELETKLKVNHPLPKTFNSYPQKKTFNYTKQLENKVLFVDYDMVQSEIRWVRNVEQYDVSQEPMISIFNEYFGGGMGSIVFQTIRESKALAYSTYASYTIPYKKEQMFQMSAYVGSQSDKMLEAVAAMNELLNDLPEDKESFKLAKEAIKKSIQTQRITEGEPIRLYYNALKKGIDYDLRKSIYEAVDMIDFEQIKDFHNQKVANKFYTYCIVGSKDHITTEDLEKIGELQMVSLEELFGY